MVGKSSLKSAVLRNLLKRRLRAILLPEARKRSIKITAFVRGKVDDLGFEVVKKSALDVLNNKNGGNL